MFPALCQRKTNRKMIWNMTIHFLDNIYNARSILRSLTKIDNALSRYEY